MGEIKAELSKKSKYWIPKHRYYELKHFCLQYPEWKKEYMLAQFKMEVSPIIVKGQKAQGRPVENLEISRGEIFEKLDLVERTCHDADPILAKWLLKSVTEGVSFTRLKMLYDIPCERDMFYDRYRKFFWLLSRRC